MSNKNAGTLITSWKPALKSNVSVNNIQSVTNDGKNRIEKTEKLDDENTSTFRYGRQPFGCLINDNCLMRFSSEDVQSIHHKFAHIPSLPYFCKSCFKSKRVMRFLTKEDLLAHKMNPKPLPKPILK